MSSKHGPNSWDDYLNVHQRRIASFADHFIVEDRVAFTRTASQVLWEGEILCVGGIEIHVRKRQTIRYRQGRPWVHTEDYSYQVIRRQGRDVTPMFRYDNSDHFDHPDAHHRHQFDANGHEILPAAHVGEVGWPTLGDVLEEARTVWLATGDAESLTTKTWLLSVSRMPATSRRRSAPAVARPRADVARRHRRDTGSRPVADRAPAPGSSSRERPPPGGTKLRAGRSVSRR